MSLARELLQDIRTSAWFRSPLKCFLFLWQRYKWVGVSYCFHLSRTYRWGVLCVSWFIVVLRWILLDNLPTCLLPVKIDMFQFFKLKRFNLLHLGTIKFLLTCWMQIPDFQTYGNLEVLVFLCINEWKNRSYEDEIWFFTIFITKHKLDNIVAVL